MLKRLFLISFLFLGLSSTRTHAQIDAIYGILTLIDLASNVEEGGADFKFTEFKGEIVPMYGLKGGWTTNNERLFFGFNGHYADFSFNSTGNSAIDAEMISTGVIIEVRHRPEERIHLSTNVAMNWAYLESYDWQGDGLDQTSFLGVEPQVAAHFSPLEFVRIGVGAGYRYAFGTQSFTFSNADLSGASYNLSVTFGRFY